MLALVGFIAIKVLSESKPKGESGENAEKLANSVFMALNKPAYDTLGYLEWEFFRPGQKYLWNKQENKVKIQFDDVTVYYDLNSMEALCYQAGKELTGKDFEKAKEKAWSNWCNDSFWVLAPFKIFDKGTTRKRVSYEGKDALLIEYASGGVTPGDAYLWILDKDSRPTGWKMWTSIIPLKGLYTSWEGWKTAENVQFSTTHTFFGKPVSIKNLKAGQTLGDLGYADDPFVKLN